MNFEINQGVSATAGALAELSGEVTAVTFRNQENGFSILKVLSAGSSEPVTVVGVTNAAIGELVDVTGSWKVHRSFGRQLEATAVTCRRPSSPRAIERFLASGAIPGIGAVLAGRIVAAFGAETMAVLDEDPTRILTVGGIGKKRGEEIARAWALDRDARKVLLALAEYEIGTAICHRIAKQYGEKALETVQAQPYRLAREIRGIGFATADAIAMKVGIARDAPERIEAGLRHVIVAETTGGNTGLPRRAFIEKASAALGLDDQVVEDSLTEHLARKEFIVPVQMHSDRYVFEASLFEAERRIARTLQEMNTLSSWVSSKGAADEITEAAQAACAVELAPEQRQAVSMALRARVGILTGGPGTGKTSTLRVILHALGQVHARVVLGAPTGKAAKRMQESTGQQAATVARLIGMGQDPTEHREIDCDVLVIDEASMLDVPMFDRVLEYLVPGASILLVGDVDQLPSVGAGNVLADMIAGQLLPTTRLTKVFRQAESSAIIRNAHRINRGAGLEPPAPAGEADFYFLEVDGAEKIAETVVRLVSHDIPTRRGIPSQEIQVLSPMRKGETGADHLNRLLQAALNPSPISFVDRGGTRYGTGDRVLQTSNNYDLNVMNGETGIIVGVDKASSVVEVAIDDRVVAYPFDNLGELDLAGAMSVHKSQGSQFAAVVIPLSSQHHIMLQRPIVYTAITRATKLCLIVGQRRALDTAIRNLRAVPRITSLRVRLQAAGAASK